MERLEVLATIFFMLICFPCFTWSQADKDLYCGVCHVIADEVEWEVSKIDPRKTLEVESFRVDPKGNQKTKKIQYSRSETYLTEVLEKICKTISDSYAESTDPKTGKKSYVRTSSRNGEAITLSNVAISAETARKIRFACETIIEDHDDDVIEVFKKKRENPRKVLCEEYAGFCVGSDAEFDDGEDDDDSDHDEL